MRIPLTIDANYLPEWGVQEGLRELIQNTLDAEDATGQRSSIRYSTRSQTVTLKNPGARLDRDALLMGMTTKADDANARASLVRASSWAPSRCAEPVLPSESKPPARTGGPASMSTHRSPVARFCASTPTAATLTGTTLS